MQSGRLFQGDIFSNIAITAPELTLDQAWEAAEMAGVADDIENMPMGMNTIISEGGGGISPCYGGGSGALRPSDRYFERKTPERNAGKRYERKSCQLRS